MPTFIHGFAQRNKTLPAEYKIWSGMKNRCANPSNKDWLRYGGRGINVHDAWLHSFHKFLSDVGARPTSAHTLERINNDLGYEPGNVRWATRTEQARNRKSTKLVTFHGESATLPEWCELLNLDWKAVKARLQIKWTIDRALSTPTRKPNQRPST
jgi:hypothetical protein